MPRAILEESRIHPAIRDKVSRHHAGLVKEVQDAIAANALVVIGMTMNPFPQKARKLLDDAGVAYKYLEYGNYFNSWRERSAIKFWTGWPTFPQIFVKGSLIGGFDDLKRLADSGELKELLA